MKIMRDRLPDSVNCNLYICSATLGDDGTCQSGRPPFYTSGVSPVMNENRRRDISQCNVGGDRGIKKFINYHLVVLFDRLFLYKRYFV